MESKICDFRMFCRFCLKGDSNLKSLFVMDDSLNRQPCEIVSEICGIIVCPDDELPSQICVPCMDTLHTTFIFISQVLKSQKILKEHVQKTGCSSFKVMKSLSELLTQKLYDCSSCGRKFITELNLVRHLMVCETSMLDQNFSSEKEIWKSEIPEADKTFCTSLVSDVEDQSSSSMDIHGEVTQATPRLRKIKRKYSDVKHKQKSSLARYKKSLINPKGVYICDHCNVDFKYLNALKEHLKLVESFGNLSCVFCGGEDYNSKQDLLSHINRHHDSKKLYLCLQCKSTFTKWESLKMHIQQKHTKEKIHCCPKCPKKYMQRRDLNRHLKTHKIKYSCNICNKLFKYTFTLAIHKKIHLNDKEQTCEECGKQFCGDLQLKRHKRIAHTGESHQCLNCNKTFSHATRLRRHQLSHNPVNEWPFQCQFCSKRFLYKHHLENHEKTHTMEKPFLCSHCGKGFIQRIHLIAHLKHHKPPKISKTVIED